MNEAVAALEYRPNLVARSLSTRRSNVIAVAITRLENSFHAELLQTFAHGLTPMGYRILLFLTDPETDGDPPIEEVLRHQPELIILAAVRFTSHFADQCQQAGVPVILINRTAEHATVSSVTGENERGGSVVAQFLLAGDHRRIGLIAGFDDSSTSAERERGFTNTLRAHGQTVCARGSGQFTGYQAARACRELLSAPEPPDAIFCANDVMAIAAIDVARREFGRKLGQDLSIVGYDNSRPAAGSGVELTSFSQAAEEMANQALLMLPNLLGAPPATSLHTVVTGELIVRQSARLPTSGIVEQNGQRIWKPQ